MADAEAFPNGLEYAKRLKTILVFFAIVGGLSLITDFVYGLLTNSVGTCIIWALACLTSGIAIGFLFGIPRIVQGSKGAAEQNDTQDYQMHVNTNLTEISDWLTKIIVGLGLVKLTKLPPYLTSMADSMSQGIRDKDRAVAMAFAYGTITCFSILGFLFGYLFTRLYLSKTIAIADQDSLQKLRGEIAIQFASLESKQGLLTHSLAKEKMGPGLDATEDTKSPASDEKLSTLANMADEYMHITFADLAQRTHAKDLKANEMGIYAIENGIHSGDIFKYIRDHPPVQEGMVMALATLINIDPQQSDFAMLLEAGRNLTRLHVRFRVLLAIVTLKKKGYIGDDEKQQAINLVKSYRLNADASLSQQIEYTLSFLDS
jgi:hypothetical protein